MGVRLKYTKYLAVDQAKVGESPITPAIFTKEYRSGQTEQAQNLLSRRSYGGSNPSSFIMPTLSSLVCSLGLNPSFQEWI